MSNGDRMRLTRNALWQLLPARNMEKAVVDTVMRGGDTDATAAMCGAPLGAVYGRDAISACSVPIRRGRRPCC